MKNEKTVRFIGYVAIAVLIIGTTSTLAINAVSQGGTTMDLICKLAVVVTSGVVAIRLIDSIVFLCTYNHIKKEDKENEKI